MTTIVSPGFIALAAMIFGKWNPIGVFIAFLVFFFGLSKVWRLSFSITFSYKVPAVYLQIAPYVLTISVMAFFGKQLHLKANGINYIKVKISIQKRQFQTGVLFLDF